MQNNKKMRAVERTDGFGQLGPEPRNYTVLRAGQLPAGTKNIFAHCFFHLFALFTLVLFQNTWKAIHAKYNLSVYLNSRTGGEKLTFRWWLLMKHWLTLSSWAIFHLSC